MTVITYCGLCSSGALGDDRVTRTADTQKTACKGQVRGSADSFIFDCGKDNDVASKHFVNNILQLKKNTAQSEEETEQLDDEKNVLMRKYLPAIGIWHFYYPSIMFHLLNGPV